MENISSVHKFFETDVGQRNSGVYKFVELSSKIENKDINTWNHSQRVAELAVLIGKEMGLSEKNLDTLRYGGLLHDIGKTEVPDNILFKNTKLSDGEYSIIKKHTFVGAEILSDALKESSEESFGNSNVMSNVVPIIKYHHERYDGKGYPERLVGEEIPLTARIMAVADSFDAMYSKRVYKDGMKLEDVVKEIKINRGTQFDPTVADAFLNIINNDFEDVKKIEEMY